MKSPSSHVREARGFRHSSADEELRGGPGAIHIPQELRPCVKLLGIGFVIVELGLAIAPSGEAPAGGADAWAVKFVATRDECEGGVFDAGGGIGQNGAQTGSGGRVRHFQPAEVVDGRIDIDELVERARRLAAFPARRGDDDRRTDTALPKASYANRSSLPSALASAMRMFVK